LPVSARRTGICDPGELLLAIPLHSRIALITEGIESVGTVLDTRLRSIRFATRRMYRYYRSIER
jgi:hypothetical protein